MGAVELLVQVAHDASAESHPPPGANMMTTADELVSSSRMR